MIKLFVIDTNCLISANLTPTISAQAYDKARSIGVLLRTHETLYEFASRFSRSKFDKYLSPADRAEAIARFKRESQVISVKEKIKVCRDPDDDKFLELAVAANASCIITGDKDLLVLHPFPSYTYSNPG